MTEASNGVQACAVALITTTENCEGFFIPLSQEVAIENSQAHDVVSQTKFTGADADSTKVLQSSRLQVPQQHFNAQITDSITSNNFGLLPAVERLNIPEDHILLFDVQVPQNEGETSSDNAQDSVVTQQVEMQEEELTVDQLLRENVPNSDIYYADMIGNRTSKRVSERKLRETADEQAAEVPQHSEPVQCDFIEPNSTANPPETQQVLRLEMSQLWELSVVLSFFSTFHKVLPEPLHEYSDIDIIEGLTDGRAIKTIVDLHISLLKPIRPAINYDNWNAYLRKKLEQPSSEFPFGLQPDRIYEQLTIHEKIRILKMLCELYLEVAPISKDLRIADDAEVDWLRPKPIGKDAFGNDFFYFEYKRSSSIYKEKKNTGRVTIELACKCEVPFLHEFIRQYERTRNSNEKKLIKYISEQILMPLEETQKSVERACKRMKAQAINITNIISEPRSRRTIRRVADQDMIYNYKDDDFEHYH